MLYSQNQTFRKYCKMNWQNFELSCRPKTFRFNWLLHCSWRHLAGICWKQNDLAIVFLHDWGVFESVNFAAAGRPRLGGGFGEILDNVSHIRNTKKVVKLVVGNHKDNKCGFDGIKIIFQAAFLCFREKSCSVEQLFLHVRKIMPTEAVNRSFFVRFLKRWRAVL